MDDPTPPGETVFLRPEPSGGLSYTFLGTSKTENGIPTYSMLRAGTTIYAVGDNVLVNCGNLEHPWIAKILLFYRDASGNMVYVSYWYYKRPDIPSGVRRRPSGRDKTGGELFFSTHLDENKVQTLMGHCKVYDRPVWLDRGSKTAPMHTYYCSKVYDLQGQLVDDAEKFNYIPDEVSEDDADVAESEEYEDDE